MTTLADIKAAADRKYGHTPIDMGDGMIVTLLNPVRLSDDKRAELTAMQEVLNEEGSNQREALCNVIRLVAQNERQAEALLAEIGDDLALLMATFEEWNDKTQAGEASASAA